MAPRASQKRHPPSVDPNDMFRGMVVFLVPKGVQPRRLQGWRRCSSCRPPFEMEMVASQKRCSPSADPNGIFHGMVIPKGVQPRRLQIWKEKLTQMGALVEDSFSKKVTHVLAMNSNALFQQVNHEQLQCFKGELLEKP